VNLNSIDNASAGSSFTLNETGEICPITGRKFMSHPEWRVDALRYGTRVEILSEQIVIERARGTYRGDEVQVCMGIIDKVMDRMPGPVVLVEDFTNVVGVDHRARRLYEQGVLARADRLRGVVFVGLKPMFRLFLRLARRMNSIPFPIYLAKNWQDTLDASMAMLEGKGQTVLDTLPAPVSRARRIPLPGFLLRGYAKELRDLVSEMPWDSAKEAVNPLAANHPFHEVVEAWVAVKRDLDWLDNLRQERERDLRATAKTLAESEGRYRAVFEASGTALLLYGADRRIRMANRAAERMAKLPRQELEGKFEWTHFSHPEDAPGLVARHNARQFDPDFDQGRIESRFIDADGQLHWADITVESIPGTDLRVASLEDRTEYRAAHLALEESERRFRQIVEVSQEGIWTSDLAGRTTWSNHCMAQLLGCAPAELQELSFLELLPTDSDQRLDVLRSLLEGHSVVFEGRLPHREGKVAWAIVSASPILGADGAPSGFFAMCTDITRRREAETALRDLNRDLEDRVRERTAELENANTELARALRAREDFLASISHELRTPLASILGAIETLHDVDDPARRGYLLELADRNGRQLLSLIEDVLDFARGRAGRLSFQPTPVDALEAVRAAAQTLEIQADRDRIRLTAGSEGRLAPVFADPVRLRQILTNFANNALRYAASGGEVEISACHDPRGVRFEVRDRGAGVPVSDRSKLFQPFVQLDPSARKGGAGLGLALSRQLAQAMGGEVGYEDRPGGGSVFWLRLPHATTAPVETTPALPNQRAKAHPTGKVLLVEDEKDLREILCEHLTANGWDVQSAHDADAAIVSFEATRPLVAVVDLGLPGRSGLELIGILRKLSKGSPLGVVALTGQAFPEDAERCMQAGADRFLTKPTTLRKTESVLRELHALMIGSESGDGERVDGAMAPQ